MPSRRTKVPAARASISAVADSNCLHRVDTRSGRANASILPACLRVIATWNGMKRERPACGRCSEVVRGCEAEWSAAEAKHRSQANPRRQSACAGAWAKWKPSLEGTRSVAGALASCTRPRSLPTFWCLLCRPYRACEFICPCYPGRCPGLSSCAPLGLRKPMRRVWFFTRAAWHLCQRSEVGGASRTGRNAVLAQRCLGLSRD
jgi:hypothetical protein